MSKVLLACRYWTNLPDVDLITSQTRLIIRKSRKFTAAAFLQSLLSSVAIGLASLNQIAGEEVACRFSSQMEVSFKILLEYQKIAS